MSRGRNPIVTNFNKYEYKLLGTKRRHRGERRYKREEMCAKKIGGVAL